MKSSLWKGILVAALAFPALSGTAQAQVEDTHGCSNATLQGDYGFSVQGESLGILTGTPPVLHRFEFPALINGVAMGHFDGAGHFTQVDFSVHDGTKVPGQTDLTTGFNGNEQGTYMVFPDCTGKFEIDDPPRPGGAVIRVHFVLARQGREIHTVVSQMHVPAGPPSADGIATCLAMNGGCDLGNNVRSDAVKLESGQGDNH